MSDEKIWQKSFIFQDFQLNHEKKLLLRAGNKIHLAKHPFDVLHFLITNRGRVVSREELLEKFWDGHDVYDDALRKCVGTIRRALDDRGKPPKFIETRYGGGYRFIGDVTMVPVNGIGANGLHAANNGATPEIDSTPETLDVSLLSRLRPLAIITVFLILLLFTLSFYIFNDRHRTSATAAEPTAGLRIRSIAVMPLKNLTGEISNEYFSDGVTESLITELARSNDLRVISRSSTFTLKDTDKDPREIGSQLGVEALLEGSLQRTGDLVNVRVRLVDTRDGSILWTSNDFEREFSAAYDLQDAIACNVAAQLQTEICGTNVNRKTINGLAYQEYLKGRFEWNKRTPDGIKKSIVHYTRAIDIDQTYALAYSGLSESYLQGIWHVPFDPREALPKARETALRALTLDPSSAEAHVALGSVFSLEWNWAEADREHRRAIELNPKLARARHTGAFLLMLTGRYDESIESINRAAEIDPLNSVITTDKAMLLLNAGRTEEALRIWDTLIAANPDFLMAREHRLTAYESIGNKTGAIEEYASIMRLKGEKPEKITAMRRVAAQDGLLTVRRREYNLLLEKKKRGDAVSPLTLAYAAALAGETFETLSWLEKAYDEHNAQLVLIVGPPFNLIQNEPQYRDLLKRVGLTRSVTD